MFVSDFNFLRDSTHRIIIYIIIKTLAIYVTIEIILFSLNTSDIC